MKPSAPLLIPSSRDQYDNRPDTSGHVPGVHYNVPMYQPLQAQQGFDPNAALLNMLSNGSYMHGGSMGQGWQTTGTQAAQMFDPRTKAGLANLAGILIPGDKGAGGFPTHEQQAFLDAIHYSSRHGQMTMNDNHASAAYRPLPEVDALAKYIGAPSPSRHQIDPRFITEAQSPLDAMLWPEGPLSNIGRTQKQHGLWPDTGMAPWGSSEMFNAGRIKGLSEDRALAILRMLGRNAIQRRN